MSPCSKGVLPEAESLYLLDRASELSVCEEAGVQLFALPRVTEAVSDEQIRVSYAIAAATSAYDLNLSLTLDLDLPPHQLLDSLRLTMIGSTALGLQSGLPVVVEFQNRGPEVLDSEARCR